MCFYSFLMCLIAPNSISSKLERGWFHEKNMYAFKQVLLFTTMCRCSPITAICGKMAIKRTPGWIIKSWVTKHSLGEKWEIHFWAFFLSFFSFRENVSLIILSDKGFNQIRVIMAFRKTSTDPNGDKETSFGNVILTFKGQALFEHVGFENVNTA